MTLMKDNKPAMYNKNLSPALQGSRNESRNDKYKHEDKIQIPRTHSLCKQSTKRERLRSSWQMYGFYYNNRKILYAR